MSAEAYHHDILTYSVKYFVIMAKSNALQQLVHQLLYMAVVSYRRVEKDEIDLPWSSGRQYHLHKSQETFLNQNPGIQRPMWASFRYGARHTI